MKQLEVPERTSIGALRELVENHNATVESVQALEEALDYLVKGGPMIVQIHAVPFRTDVLLFILLQTGELKACRIPSHEFQKASVWINVPDFKEA